MLTVRMQTAIQKLQKGEIIVIPTETVYGLAVDAGSNTGIDALYALKGRESQKPLQLMVHTLQVAEKLVKIDARARKIAAAFLPGPLTLVLPSNLAPEASLAIRIPNHPQTLALLAEYGRPLATTSANPSGGTPARTAEEAKNLYPQLLIIEGGDCAIGIASTVVDLTGPEIKILREGSITKEQLNSRL